MKLTVHSAWLVHQINELSPNLGKEISYEENFPQQRPALKRHVKEMLFTSKFFHDSIIFSSS